MCVFIMGFLGPLRKRFEFKYTRHCPGCVDAAGTTASDSELMHTCQTCKDIIEWLVYRMVTLLRVTQVWDLLTAR